MTLTLKIQSFMLVSYIYFQIRFIHMALPQCVATDSGYVTALVSYSLTSPVKMFPPAAGVDQSSRPVFGHKCLRRLRPSSAL